MHEIGHLLIHYLHMTHPRQGHQRPGSGGRQHRRLRRTETEGVPRQFLQPSADGSATGYAQRMDGHVALQEESTSSPGRPSPHSPFIFPWQPASNCQSVHPVGGPSNGLNAGMPSSHSSGSGFILPLPFSTCLFGASLSACQRASLRSASGVTCELVAFPLRGKDVR